ncbi:hypothetical protein C8R46DRAFT_1043261 [Mycena filopes]|nr:hypothetical protein C8R46DRAFT_1043261 [Mycena filopes]
MSVVSAVPKETAVLVLVLLVELLRLLLGQALGRDCMVTPTPAEPAAPRPRMMRMSDTGVEMSGYAILTLQRTTRTAAYSSLQASIQAPSAFFLEELRRGTFCLRLSGLDLELLKDVIKTANNVVRMNPQWKVGSDAQIARKKILADKVSVNWLAVQTPLEKELDEDYILDTISETHRNIDKVFRTWFASGKVSVPGQPALGSPEIPDKDIDIPSTSDQDGKPVEKPLHKIFVVISDERGSTVTTRAAVLYVEGVTERDSQYFVQTHELVTELQASPEAIHGMARLAINISHGGMNIRTAFYMLRKGADYVGLPAVPEVRLSKVEVGDATGCDYTLPIFLEAAAPSAETQTATGKRHFSTRSTDDEAEQAYRASRPGSADPSASTVTDKIKYTSAQRDAAQLQWLQGLSGYDNVIAQAMRVQIKTKQPQSTCALAIFAAYVHIVSNITPGDTCAAAGQSDITNKLLGQFLGCQADYIGVAKATGLVQVTAGSIATVKEHMDGEMADSYMGMAKWKEFMEQAIEIHNTVKTE